MQRMPPLNALQAFLVVARHRSFTRAAQHLCLTQGAVSRQILALEDHYGFQLFTRLPKGLTLTVEGEILLPVVTESFAADTATQRSCAEGADLCNAMDSAEDHAVSDRISRHPDSIDDYHPT